jgi:ABC-type phosphate transport system substrate-binding protein
VLLIMMLPGTAATATDRRYLTAPFSPPLEQAEVPVGWQQQPVKYAADHKQADLVISLGQQSYPALHRVIRDYATTQGLNIVIQKGTCGISAGRLLRKTVDIGGYCCPPGKNDRLPGLAFHTLGIAPIGLLVHPDNPLRNVSLAQAREIYKGRISRWSQLSSASQHKSSLIQPVARLHCKTRPGHWRRLLKNEDQFGPRLYEVGVIQDMISHIMQNPYAIGYETSLMVKEFGNGKVRFLDLDGHSIDDTGYILAGNYPLYRTYNLATWTGGEKQQTANDMIKALIRHVEEHHKEYNFIPVSQLRAAGWRFRDGELIGEPGNR